MSPDQAAAFLAGFDSFLERIKPLTSQSFDHALDPPNIDARADACQEAEQTMRALILDHGRKCLRIESPEATDDSEPGMVKVELEMRLEVNMNHPHAAAEALRLLAEGLEKL